ncbi:MAG: bifunctional ornithine acetyltransferase/N-acetylglutamate synthase, partial [Thermoguttaceae bacterium]
MADRLPRGYQAAGVYSGVKQDAGKLDLSLIVSERPAVAAGVFTKNLVFGAPVKLNRERTPSDSIRAVVINSGVANACTGAQGEEDARSMATKVAQVCRYDDQQVLVLSTGVIGELLPMEKICAGIEAAAAQLRSDEAALIAAAQGMMTTDTRHKICSREFELDRMMWITGVAKGAAMIGPNMATMLSVVMTDAPISVDDARAGLKDAVDESFNCISVDGHMSTSDTVLLLANGAAGGEVLSGSALSKFQATLV